MNDQANDCPEQTVDDRPRDETLREAFDAYYAALCAFFLRRGFSREQSQDLAQETFSKAFESLGQLRSTASLKSWLLGIAANTWRNALRHAQADKRRAEHVPLDETTHAPQAAGPMSPMPVIAPSLDPLEQVLAGERRLLVHRALRDMPPQMRRCMQLHVGLDLKYREVALVLGISINTVKNQIHRAKAHLEARLAPHFVPAATLSRSLDHE
jgi:RNA polymerase sigma-70 factor (ECF subfamily)